MLPDGISSSLDMASGGSRLSRVCRPPGHLFGRPVGRRFVEADGWKARITVDCLLKDKLCGSFRYETLACEGDLIYSGETPTGFDSAPTSHRALPGVAACNLQRFQALCRSVQGQSA